MKNQFTLLLVLSAFSACYQVDTSQIQNLNNNSIEVIGHGGNGYKSFINYLPMNTFESITKAIEENNADGVEMDVQLSAENRLVVFHDKMLEQSTDCNGLVINQTENEISACVYSSFFCRLTGKKYHVVVLEEILQHFSSSEKKPLLVFDLKLYPAKSMDKNYMEQFATAIAGLINKYSYLDQAMIESNSYEMLSKLKSINHELKLFIYPGDFESGFATAKEIGLDGITIRNSLIKKEQVEQAHQNGLLVTIWGTRSKKSNWEAILKNPDFIQTDNINNLTSLLN